jgi:hypothetical protein
VALAVLGFARSASGATLEWSAAPPCPDRDEAVARVERVLGTKLADTQPLAFSAAATRVGERFRLTLSVADGEGPTSSRTLEAGDCEKLVDALAVTMALALGLPEPEIAGEAQGAAGEAPPARRAAPPPEKPKAAAEGAGSTARTRVAVRAGPWMLVDFGSLPAVAFGAALEAELSLNAFGIRAFGEIFPERFGEVDSPAAAATGAGASVGLIAGGVLGCYRPGAQDQWLGAGLCLGAEVGRLSGQGEGVLEARLASAWWFSPRFDARLELTPNKGFVFGLLAGAVVPLIRDEFVLQGIGTVHRPPAVAARLGLGLELEFE